MRGGHPLREQITGMVLGGGAPVLVLAVLYKQGVCNDVALVDSIITSMCCLVMNLLRSLI